MVPPINSSTRFGWIGLGSMGTAMAQNLQKYLTRTSNPALRVYNRSIARTRPLVSIGAVASDSISSLAVAADVIFISVSDDDAVLATISQILTLGSGLLVGKTIIDTTTTHPRTTTSVSEQLMAAGAAFLACPCFGATPVAQAGRLLMAVGGPEPAATAVAEVLRSCLARDVIRTGPDPAQASMLKTTGNFLIAGIMEIVAEALVLAEKSGLGTDIAEHLIKLNFGDLAYSDCQRMTQGIYMPGIGEQPWSDLNLALKDVGHGLSSAKDVGVKLETGEVIMANLKAAKAYSQNHANRALDSSSLYGALREKANLDFATNFIKQRDIGDDRKV